ncbi:hypothetical protein NX059_006190 [Plenodomus lindquistii]|nr:hypothetical protein NX059_006190 [Plenodomus lindquistii]
MVFNNHIFTAATLFSTFAIALPLEGRDIVPRNKSYDVVNVGGSQTAETTTKTVEVISPGPTVEVTATIAIPEEPRPTSSTSKSSSSTSRASSTPTATSSCPETSAKSTSTTMAPSSTKSASVEIIYVTVSVPDDGPYYDDGMWHTRYRVKTFEAAASVTPAAVASS